MGILRRASNAAFATCTIRKAHMFAVIPQGSKMLLCCYIFSNNTFVGSALQRMRTLAAGFKRQLVEPFSLVTCDIFGFSSSPDSRPEQSLRIHRHIGMIWTCQHTRPEMRCCQVMHMFSGESWSHNPQKLLSNAMHLPADHNPLIRWAW